MMRVTVRLLEEPSLVMRCVSSGVMVVLLSCHWYVRVLGEVLVHWRKRLSLSRTTCGITGSIVTLRAVCVSVCVCVCVCVRVCVYVCVCVCARRNTIPLLLILECLV